MTRYAPLGSKLTPGTLNKVKIPGNFFGRMYDYDCKNSVLTKINGNIFQGHSSIIQYEWNVKILINHLETMQN